MYPFADYHIRQGGGGHQDDFFGSPYAQSRHDTDRFFADQFGAAKPLSHNGVSLVAYEALEKQLGIPTLGSDNTRAKIVADSARQV